VGQVVEIGEGVSRDYSNGLKIDSQIFRRRGIMIKLYQPTIPMKSRTDTIAELALDIGPNCPHIYLTSVRQALLLDNSLNFKYSSLTVS
jgi:hypothetical protein